LPQAASATAATIASGAIFLIKLCIRGSSSVIGAGRYAVRAGMYPGRRRSMVELTFGSSIRTDKARDCTRD
jgi:hypothetical protein